MRFATIVASILITTASLFASVSATNASVIFDNIGSGYNCCSGVSVGGPSSFVGKASFAAQFTATSDDVISEIKLGMSVLFGDGNVFLTLNSDAGGKIGSGLRGVELTILNDISSTTETVDWNNVGIRVVAGDSYWIMASATGSDWDGWNFNAEGVMGPTFNSFNGIGYSTGTLPAFTVLGGGTPLPEPSSWALSVVGFAMLGAALRQRRRPAVQ